ncbi:MAG: 50S ribosomal protein L3 [Parcubacteria group bacterium]|nr:50S ribosomal protein L3 [Parcubacteria group bacterium]
MKYILGKKQYMTQVFDENGTVHPATVISAGPIVVTQIRSKEKDGYEAVQVGYGTTSGKRLTKAQKGHFGDKGFFQHAKEFRPKTSGGLDGVAVGNSIDVSVFSKGDMVSVAGVSKGKGFQGVVKRHGFKGGPRSHGQKHSEREPGSIGGGGRAGGRVIRGMRMAGRMGGDRIQIKNLTVLATDTEAQTLIVSGAVPGRRGTLLEIRG